MPFCPNCGNQVADSAKFCSNCGGKITPPVVAEEPVYTPVVVEEPVYAAPAVEEPVYAAPVAEAPAAEYPVNPVMAEEEAKPQPVQEAPVYAAPAEPAYVPPVVERAKPEKVSLIAKKPLGIGKKILVICLCVLVFIFGMGTVAAVCVRNVVNEDIIALVLENVDLSEMAASTIIGDAEEDVTIVDWLREELIKRDPAWEKLSTKDLEDFINTQIKPFIAEQGGEFLEVILTGKGEASIDKKDVQKLVDSSVEFIEKEYGVVVTDEMADDLVNYIDSFGVSEVASTEYLEEEFPEIMELIPTVTSVLPLVIFGALTAVFLVLVLLVNKSLIRDLNCVGVLATAIGGVYSAAFGVVLLVPDLLKDLYGELDFIGAIVEEAASSCLIIPLILLGVGVVVLLISKLLQSIKVTKK